jgi:hypothetical protein
VIYVNDCLYILSVGVIYAMDVRCGAVGRGGAGVVRGFNLNVDLLLEKLLRDDPFA